MKTSSRIDPAGIELKAGPVFEATDGGWTLDETDAVKDAKGKPVTVSSGGEGAAGRPSQVNHGNIVPSIDGKAGVLPRITSRRSPSCRSPPSADCVFPWTPRLGRSKATVAQRPRRQHTPALAALGLAATVLALEDGFDLRSRRVLAPTGPIGFELLSRDGDVAEFVLGRAEALGVTG